MKVVLYTLPFSRGEKMKKFNIVSLGCPKNTVDSEVLKGSLKRAGLIYCDEPEDSDIVIINTCGFIKDAKEESIETIFEAINLKNEDESKTIIAMGCLTQRYMDDLKIEIPELDGIYGIDSQLDIVKNLTQNRFSVMDLATTRDLITPSYQAYLKIAEGCDNKCAFCAIPGIRGPQRSRAIDDILREAEYLAQKGVKEVVLTAQDLTRYGKDKYGDFKLYDLVDELMKAKLFPWVRIMYTNPDFWNPEILDLYNKYDELCKYIDIPVQHASDRILKLMNRGNKSASIRQIISEIRSKVPDIAIRTSIITGFPSETDEDFSKLLDFVEEMKFERLGVFTYSEEEDTRAALLDDDVPEDVKESRREQLMDVQYDIASAFARNKIGQEVQVLIEQEDNGQYIGRTMWDAPEVDCFAVVSSENELKIGEFYSMKVTNSSGLDLIGKVE